MSLPAIGVVIPCYKAEHTLRQTVESASIFTYLPISFHFPVTVPASP